MTFKTLDTPACRELKRDLEAYPRLCGYYLIDFVAVGEERKAFETEEEFLDALFQHFDDQTWPPKEQRPTDQSWADYRATEEGAGSHLIESLVGGPSIGHTRETIPADVAATYWNRFRQLFGPDVSLYTGMGFGDSKHVFQYGVAAVDKDRAGVLCIVESD